MRPRGPRRRQGVRAWRGGARAGERANALTIWQMEAPNIQRLAPGIWLRRYILRCTMACSAISSPPMLDIPIRLALERRIRRLGSDFSDVPAERHKKAPRGPTLRNNLWRSHLAVLPLFVSQFTEQQGDSSAHQAVVCRSNPTPPRFAEK